MKYILATLTVAAITLSNPSRSTAEVYIEIGGGAAYLKDWEFTESIVSKYDGTPLSLSGDYDGTYKFENGRALTFEIGKKRDKSGLWNHTSMWGFHTGISYNEISGSSYIENPLGSGNLSLSQLGVKDSLEVYRIPLLAVFTLETELGDKLSLNAGIGGGVNIMAASTGYSSNIENTQDLAFQFQVKAGLDYAISENVSLGLDVRFSGYTSPEFENEGYGISSTTEGDTMTGHFIGLGLTIAW